MQITLYKAAEELRDLLDHLDPETGEMPEGFEAARDLVERKATAVAGYAINADKTADLIEAHVKEMATKAKALRARSAWLKGYLQSHMSQAGITRIASEDGTFTATLQMGRDESVDVWDVAQLPREFITVKTTEAPDKRGIADAIKQGVDVPGARLVLKNRLTIK